MHIAFLTPEYPHPQLSPSGGLGTSIKNLAEQLAAQNHRVSVVVCGQKNETEFKENGIHFHILKQKRYKFFGFYLYRKHVARYLNALTKKEQIDLIEAPDWTGLTAFMKFKVPLIIRFNGSDAYFCHLEGRKQKRKNYFFERLALHNADGLVSVSAFTAQVTKDIFNIQKPIDVIPNSIAIERFMAQPEKELPNRILYFGTLIRKKGVLELAPIFNEVHTQMPDTEFVFAGKDVVDIQTKQSTKALLENALNTGTKTQTHFLGELPYAHIQEEIAKATVIVLPSYAEAMPMTWLEAMAMEKALVTSNIGWANELMIHGKTGYTVAPKDHETFANAIVELLQDKALRRNLGAQARQQVITGFSTEVVTQKNLTWYTRQIQTHSRIV